MPGGATVTPAGRVEGRAPAPSGAASAEKTRPATDADVLDKPIFTP